MTITLRSTKGVELTHAELDGNFTDLDGRVTALQGTSSLDSAATIALVDSAYVQSREATPTITINRFDYSADSGQTVFTDSDDNGNVLSFDSGTTQVYLNGLLLNPALDYTLTLGDTVTTTTGIDSDHLITITSLSVS